MKGFYKENYAKKIIRKFGDCPREMEGSKQWIIIFLFIFFFFVET